MVLSSFELGRQRGGPYRGGEVRTISPGRSVCKYFRRGNNIIGIPSYKDGRTQSPFGLALLGLAGSRGRRRSGRIGSRRGKATDQSIRALRGAVRSNPAGKKGLPMRIVLALVVASRKWSSVILLFIRSPSESRQALRIKLFLMPPDWKAGK